ncbi:MAG TPA: hypothetical protein VNM14_22385 [Planctomycetota bacterium]|jgi:hypothetical protein|nr:hypothetical protein [Planctomycetota bacterium]
MLLLILASLLPQETEDYFPLKPGMTWEFENADGKTETKSVGDVKKIGDREYRLIRNALVGTPPERDIPAVVSAEGVTLFDEHDQVDVCWLKLPIKAGAEWTHKSRVGSLAMKLAAEEEIEVPAGKYKALKVVADLEVNGAKGRMTVWYAKGVGEVRSELCLRVNDENRTWSRRLKKVETPPAR